MARWSVLPLFTLLWSASACSPKPAEEPRAETPAPSAVPAANQAAPAANTLAPAEPSKASGKRVGLGFAGNMVGEIEPCGCKANPTGGLARRSTIVEAWRQGNPERDKVAATGGGEVDPKAAMMAAHASTLGPVKFDAFLTFDAGDTFSESPLLEGERLDRAKKTAALIVERFNAEGLSAQLIGDKDLALGKDTLAELRKQAKYPFLATNLVEGPDAHPVFERSVVVEAAGLRFGVIGLITASAAQAPKIAELGLTLQDPTDAARRAVEELEKQGVDVVVALSQLSPAEEEAVVKAVPRIQLFLGGDMFATSQGPVAVGSAWSLTGGQKGRSVAIAALAFDDPKGPAAPLFDPDQRGAIEKKLADATHRVETYERLLAEAEKAEAAEKAQAAANAPAVDPLRRRSPIEAYKTQVAAARADKTLAETQLAELPAAADAPRNTVALQLINLGREIADDEAVKAQVDAFRKDVPAPATH